MITKEEQLKYCNACIHKKDHDRYGVLCGLTDNYPTFSETCEHFSKVSSFSLGDSKAENKPKFNPFTDKKAKKKTKTGSFLGKGILIYILIKIALKVFKQFVD